MSQYQASYEMQAARYDEAAEETNLRRRAGSPFSPSHGKTSSTRSLFGSYRHSKVAWLVPTLLFGAVMMTMRKMFTQVSNFNLLCFVELNHSHVDNDSAMSRVTSTTFILKRSIHKYQFGNVTCHNYYIFALQTLVRFKNY